MQVTNRDGWILSLNNEMCSVIDPHGSKVNNATFLVSGSLANQEEVVDKIRSLSKNASNAFSFQVFKNDSKVAVLIGPYGLSGGGKYGALAASIAGLAGGVVLSFKNKKAGQALIASSFNAAVYAYKTPADKFDDKECLAKAAIAGTTSLATSTLSDAINGPIKEAISSPMAAQIVSQGVVSLVQEGAAQAIKGELSLKKMAVSVASSSASVFAGETVNGLIEAKDVPELVIRAGISGTAGASAATATEDLLTGKSLTNVPAAALSAGILSSINSLPGAFEVSDAIKAAEKANRNIPTPPEPPKPPKAPPKKPDVSHLNLEKRKQEIAEREKQVSSKETAYTNAFAAARSRIAYLLNAGFHDRAKWCKTADQSAERILKGEKVTVRKKDHTISYKQTAIHKPVNERATLEADKANLAQDVAIADNALKTYDTNLKAYNQEIENRFIYCPPPAPPAPTLPKMGSLPVATNWNEGPSAETDIIERKIRFNYQIRLEEKINNLNVLQLVTRPTLINATLPLEILEEPASFDSYKPQELILSNAKEVKSEKGELFKSQVTQNLENLKANKNIDLLCEKLSAKIDAIKRVKKHIAYLQNKKAHAPKSARDKKQKLTEQIDAHNERLEKLLKS